MTETRLHCDRCGGLVYRDIPDGEGWTKRMAATYEDAEKLGAKLCACWFDELLGKNEGDGDLETLADYLNLIALRRRQGGMGLAFEVEDEQGKVTAVIGVHSAKVQPGRGLVIKPNWGPKRLTEGET